MKIDERWYTLIKQELNLIPVYHFPVLWDGWECDSNGFVCKDDSDNKFYVLTNHGDPYISNEKELKEKIKEYKEVIQLTEKAIKIKNNF